MRSDRQNGSHTPVGIKESIDEMQIARATTPRTDRQLPGKLSFGSGRKSCGLFVSGVDPINLAAAMQSVGHRVGAVTDKSANSLDAGLGKSLDQFFRHGSRHDVHSP